MPIPLHGGVGTKSKAVGTIPVGQVRVLTGSTHNHTIVLARCTEVPAGPRGQSQGWDRRGLQEMNHNGGRSAQSWLICIVEDGDKPLITWAGLHILPTPHQSCSFAFLHTPAPQFLLPVLSLPPLVSSLSCPSLFHYLNSYQAHLYLSGCRICLTVGATTQTCRGYAEVHVTSMELLLHPSRLALPRLAVHPSNDAIHSSPTPGFSVPLGPSLHSWLRHRSWLSFHLPNLMVIASSLLGVGSQRIPQDRVGEF